MFRILFGDKNCRDDEDCVALVKYAKDFAGNTVGSLIVDFMPQARILCGPGINKFLNATYIMERLILKKLKEHRESYDPENLKNMTDALLKAANEADESERQLGINESLLVEGTTQEMMGTGLQPMFPLLRWAVLYMIAYPDIQAQVQQELDAVIGKEQQVCFEDRSKLPFTEACIHEIMRHAPLFPVTIPHSTTTDTTINDYFIPKNTFVLVNLYSLTRDERYWKEPEKFEPRRFLTDRGKIRDDLVDKFYPFGLGKRRCFGEYLGRLEMFIFFSNLLHKCKIERVAGEKLSLDGVPGTMLHTEDYQIVVKPRF
jgi:cytochrome P450